MKKSVVYPDWVEKYRGKGRSIRKVRNGYGLYKCSSVYVKGAKYPKSVSTYLGMITEKDGFIPKTDVSLLKQPKIYLEYGLSHFVLANFKRDIIRSVYGGLSDDTLLAGIVYFLFGSTSEVFVKATYCTKDCIDDVLYRIHSGIKEKRLKTISNKINQLICEKIPDEKDRLILLKLLPLCVIDTNGNEDSVIYRDEIKEIIERYGLSI